MLYSFSRDFGQRGTYVEAISGERERERESSVLNLSTVTAQVLTWLCGTFWGRSLELRSVNCWVGTSGIE